VVQLLFVAVERLMTPAGLRASRSIDKASGPTNDPSATPEMAEEGALQTTN
jgi:hypothetical protein